MPDRYPQAGRCSITALLQLKYFFFLSIFSILFFLSNNCCIAFAKKELTLYPLIHFQNGIDQYKKGDLKNAVVSFNNALTLNPSDLPTLISLSQVFMELSRFDLAVSALEKALKLSPADPLVHALLGNAYLEQKKISAAEEEYRAAIKLDPENILLKSLLGTSCSVNNNFKCSIEDLGAVVALYPNDIKSRILLAVSYHSVKDYATSREHYKYILEKMPDEPYIWYNLAKAEYALGNMQEANECLNQAILKNNSESEFYLDRGLINYELGKHTEAESDYLQAVKLEPENPAVAVEYASFLWKTGALNKAVEQLEKAISLEPDNNELYVYKAYLQQSLKKYDEAKKSWESILSSETNNHLALFNLAKINFDKGNYASSAELLKKINTENAESGKIDPELKYVLACSLHLNKNYDEAYIFYKDALDNNLDDPGLFFNIGLLLNEQKKYKESVSYLDTAIKKQFLNPSKAFKELIFAYTSLGDNASLKNTYKKWIEADANNVNARIEYAKFLAKNNSIQEAIDQYRVAVVLSKDVKTRLQLAQFLLLQKDLFGAVGQLQEYLKSEPNDLNALILLANAYKDLGINEEAINTYKRIIVVQYDNHLAYYNLGLLYQNQSNYQEAQNYFLKSIELNDKYSPAYYALGLSYITANNEQKAKELFDKYLEIDPNGEYKEKVENKLKELIDKPSEKLKEEKQAA